MLVLAFDASPKNIGYALYEDRPIERGKIKIETKKLKNDSYQLLSINSNNFPSINQIKKFGLEDNIWPWFCRAVQVVLRTIQKEIGMPDYAAMDQYFFRPTFNANVKSVFGVAEVTGAIMFGIHQYFGLETIRTAPATKYCQFNKRSEFIEIKNIRKESKEKLQAAKQGKINLLKEEKKSLERIINDSSAKKKALVKVLVDIYALSNMSLDEADALGLARYIHHSMKSQTEKLL